MGTDRRLIIVSGLSGSGKSVALHVLEDLGYYCMDNLPAALLQAAVVASCAGPPTVHKSLGRARFDCTWIGPHIGDRRITAARQLVRIGYVGRARESRGVHAWSSERRPGTRWRVRRRY